MKWFALLLVSLSCCTFADGQTSSAAAQAIASRQTEVDRLAQALYATRLDDGSWTRHEIPLCSSLTHHVIARFDETPSDGAGGRFLAFYDLETPPSPLPDKPWKGGILLLRLNTPLRNREAAEKNNALLIAAFNRILRQERSASPEPLLSAVDLGNCFASVSGEQPIISSSLQDAPAAQTGPLPVSSVQIALVSPAGTQRTEYLRFDSQGNITEAAVTVQRLHR